MDISLFSAEIHEFINANLASDTTKLALQKNSFSNEVWLVILNQISAKQKIKAKLPIWFNTPDIIYPSKTSLEQTSSEKTAQYKSELMSGSSLIDVTGGFGVDDYYFAKKIKHVIHCEINSELSKIVSHNTKALQSTNIECIHGDSTEILKNTSKQFDWLYSDPSRRNDTKGKVFMLKDCLPNVPELLPFYFEYTSNILIKTAPILDISAGLTEISNVKSIHIVALDNEVKELLWVLEKNYSSAIEIICSNVTKDKVESFRFEYGQTAVSSYNLPMKYLYEPNAAIMKSGGFGSLSKQFEIDKLHPHSHLFTAEHLIDFPGRIFEIESSIAYTKQNMKLTLAQKKANITTRNFPESVENIRKKWNIKEGGTLYCFFTTDVNDTKIVLLCKKLK